jgi:hypothetical protein
MRNTINLARAQLARNVTRLFEKESIPEKINAAWYRILKQWRFKQQLNTQKKERKAFIETQLKALNQQCPTPLLDQALTLLATTPYSDTAHANQLQQLLNLSLTAGIATEEGIIPITDAKHMNPKLLNIHLQIIAAIKLLGNQHYLPATKIDAELPEFIQRDMARINKAMRQHAADLKASMIIFLALHKHSYLPSKKQTLEALSQLIQQNKSSTEILQYIDRFQKNQVFLDEIYTKDQRFCLSSSPAYKTSLYLECAKHLILKQASYWDETTTARIPSPENRAPADKKTMSRQSSFRIPSPIEFLRELTRANKSTQTLPLPGYEMKLMGSINDDRHAEFEAFKSTLQKLSQFLDQRFKNTNSSGIAAIERLIKRHLKSLINQPNKQKLDQQDKKLIRKILAIANSRLKNRWGNRSRFRFSLFPGRHPNVHRFYQALFCSSSIKRSLDKLSPSSSYQILTKKLSEPFIQSSLKNKSIKFTHPKPR